MPKPFSEIMKDWFARFHRLKPGQAISILEDGRRDPDLFLEMCKHFIDSGNPDFSLSEDYKYLKRDSPIPGTQYFEENYEEKTIERGGKTYKYYIQKTRTKNQRIDNPQNNTDMNTIE